MVYLDNASTTKQLCEPWTGGMFPNPNSPHTLGVKAKRELEDCRKSFKDLLGVKFGKVIFGGTSSMLIKQLVNLTHWQFAYCSKYEHDCVLKNSWKAVDFDTLDFSNSFSKNKFYAHIHVNNITGEVYDLEKYGREIRKSGGFFIVDTTATWGHENMPRGYEEWCDCVVGSAHKFHGPQGTGFMWVSDRLAKYLNLNESTTDEYGFWWGTQAVENIKAMTGAMHLFRDKREVELLQSDSLYYMWILINFLHDNGIEARIVDKDRHKTYAINALVLDGFDADALVQYLSSKEIFISPGHSACAEDGDYRVLEACGLTKEEAKSTIRVSFSRCNKASDVEKLVNGIVDFRNKFMQNKTGEVIK